MQQHKTNMINDEWNETQNDASLVAFNDMRAVTFVLPDEMADVSIAGLQWFILIPRLNHTGSVGSIPDRDRPKSLKLVVVAFPLGAQDYGNSATTGPPVSG